MLEPDDDEPGPWFQELAEAPPDTKCHRCRDPAELEDEDGQFWCAPCAGEHDNELRWNNEEL